MIVPSMSNKEIEKEVLSDYDSVYRKLCHTFDDVKRNLIKTKNYPFNKAYDSITSDLT